MKKILCALLCLLMLAATGCSTTRTSTEPSTSPEATQLPEESAQPEASDAAEETWDGSVEGETDFYTEDDAEYRDLYSNNPIEEALDDDFTNAVTVEDFDALAQKYVDAWKSEYYALMDELIAASPDAAEELEGLRTYTDTQAQEAYDAAYAANTYTDENGEQQAAAGAAQNANFDMAEIYKNATILSILNDYRGEQDYVFHYTAQ